MNHALGFSSTVYGAGAGVFFLGYFLMEVPGNLIMTKVGARIWMTRILVTWGIISMTTALVKTPGQFYVVRFLLGMAEASFSPGIVFYLTHWFRARDQAKAVAFYITAMPACNVIASPISAALLGVTWLGFGGWQWLFILEGIPALVLGVVTFFYLTDIPEQAKWLTSEERGVLVQMMQDDKAAKSQRGTYNLRQSFLDRDVLLLSVIYFAWMGGLYGITMFLPILVKGLQSAMSNQTVGYLVMLPYLAAFITMILVSIHSDKVNERRYHIMACMLVSAIGLAGSVYLSTVSIFVAMALYAVALMGVNAAFGPFWAIPSSFLQGAGAAGAIAMINSIGNLGGFAGPYSMGYIRDATGSYNSGVLFLSGGLVTAALLMMMVRRSGTAEVTITPESKSAHTYIRETLNKFSAFHSYSG
jgi:nitrate/nitrite transporter NarK